MGDINVIELVLLAIVTFIFAIDQFSLTELIYRPMIACPIIGVILGDPATGLAIGGTYELMMVGNMPIGGAQPPVSLRWYLLLRHIWIPKKHWVLA